jgi:opacity protein-like surface antigen
MRIASEFSTSLLASFALVGSVFFPRLGLAQVTREVGGGIGGMNYRGEVSPRYRVLNNRPAATLFYRRDISTALAWRGGITLGSIRAADANVERNGTAIPIAAARRANFQAFLAEVLLGIEYNFLDYYDMKRHTRWTPYLFTGIAGYYASTDTNYRTDGESAQASANRISGAFPIGLGVKYALSREINLGFEGGGRRTFGDNFDNLTEADAPQLADPGGPDWYFYSGVSLSYTFYEILCPSGHPRPRRR